MHIVYQMLDFLPQNIKDALTYVNLQNVYELRLRADKPITINYWGKYHYLASHGVTDQRGKAMICTFADIADCVYRAGNYSVYSVEEQLKKGFLTTENGERIGLAGEYVFEKGQPLTLRNFTSLCVRVPHEVVGSGEEIYRLCMFDRIRNLLLMSSPGLGKTTILRDLGRIIGLKTKKNVLICDERGELSVGELGETCDIIKFCDKKTAFEAGIRAMRPDIIITDELSVQDCEAIRKAYCAGICVLASAHFSDIKRLEKAFLGLFERYVLLDEQNLGKIKYVFDENGEVLM